MLSRVSALRAAGADVAAATVDHRLRRESALEAERVADAARLLGVPHAILVWDQQPKPTAGLQAASRKARYQLLARRAASIGAGAIAVAHTADDQAETVLMRLARGAGVDGLSGIAAFIRIADGPGPPIGLMRPFLGARRGDLRAAADGSGLTYFDDPSNADPAFERVRIRQFLSGPAADVGLSVEALSRTARRLAETRDRLRREENDRLSALEASFTPWGGVRLKRGAIEPDRDADLLARLVRAVSGGDYRPDSAAVRDAALNAKSGKTTGIGGAQFAAWRDDNIFIYREPAAIMGRAGVAPIAPVMLAPGERTLWDRRFVIENRTTAAAFAAPLGVARDLSGFQTDWRAPKPALASTPALFAVADGAIGPPIAAPLQANEMFSPLHKERFDGGVIRY